MHKFEERVTYFIYLLVKKHLPMDDIDAAMAGAIEEMESGNSPDQPQLLDACRGMAGYLLND